MYAIQKPANMMPTDNELAITPTTHDKHRVIITMQISFLIGSSILIMN